MKYKTFQKFASKIQSFENNIYIQAHNFPDPDAIASAVGLQYLLKNFNICSQITYFGKFQRTLNKELLETFKIQPINIESIDSNSLIFAVDGNPENSNFIKTKGKYIALFDHHIENKKSKNKINWLFSESKPNIGSTSTLIALHLIHNKIKIPKKLATLLAIGLYTDTSGLKRKTTTHDLKVFNNLIENSNSDLFRFFVENSLQKNDFPYLKQAIRNSKITGHSVRSYIKGNFNPSILGLIADILLKIIEIDWVIIYGLSDEIYFSARSLSSDISCIDIFNKNFKSKAFYGGHDEMAGGRFKNPKEFNLENYLKIQE